MKASDIVVESQSSILMKGPFGHGKTLAAASFAIEGPIFLAYFDKKKPIELIHFFKKHRPELLKNIEFEVYGAHNANLYLNKLIDFANDCRYVAVITDSVTQLTSAAVNWSLGFRKDAKFNKTKDKILPDWDEYKIETSLVTQALDISRTLPCHVIWTCHPVPSIKVEGAGASIKVTKTNPIVTYGSKVAGIVPGNFSEIYHFSKQSGWDANISKNTTKYLVSTDSIGDDFAKSNLGLKGEFDITDKLFYEIWKEQIKKLKEEQDALVQTTTQVPNPFDNLVTDNSATAKRWNAEKGTYE